MVSFNPSFQSPAISANRFGNSGSPFHKALDKSGENDSQGWFDESLARRKRPWTRTESPEGLGGPITEEQRQAAARLDLSKFPVPASRDTITGLDPSDKKSWDTVTGLFW